MTLPPSAMTMSFPAPALTVSFPPPVQMTSLPGVPVSVSAAEVPWMVHVGVLVALTWVTAGGVKCSATTMAATITRSAVCAMPTRRILII